MPELFSVDLVVPIYKPSCLPFDEVFGNIPMTAEGKFQIRGVRSPRGSESSGSITLIHEVLEGNSFVEFLDRNYNLLSQAAEWISAHAEKIRQAVERNEALIFIEIRTDYARYGVTLPPEFVKACAACDLKIDFDIYL